MRRKTFITRQLDFSRELGVSQMWVWQLYLYFKSLEVVWRTANIKVFSSKMDLTWQRKIVPAEEKFKHADHWAEQFTYERLERKCKKQTNTQKLRRGLYKDSIYYKSHPCSKMSIIEGFPLHPSCPLAQGVTLACVHRVYTGQRKDSPSQNGMWPTQSDSWKQCEWLNKLITKWIFWFNILIYIISLLLHHSYNESIGFVIILLANPQVAFLIRLYSGTEQGKGGKIQSKAINK